MPVTMRVFDTNSNVILAEILLPSVLRYSYGLNSSAEFSGEIPQNWPNVHLIEVGQAVEFRKGKTAFLSGNLQRVDRTLGSMLNFTGMGLLDAVYDEKTFGLSEYDESPLLGVLMELLREVGWVLGDISTLEDPDQLTSLDLRSEGNLLVQLNKLLAGIPELYYREGALILGYPSLDLGGFQGRSGIRALTPTHNMLLPADNPDMHWIQDLTYKEDRSDVIYASHVVGGPVTDQLGIDRVINLGDAVEADRNRLIDPDFPIIEDVAEQSWAVLNYRDFGRTGGVVRSTVLGTDQVIIGDSSAGEVNMWAIMTFLPFPGILESFALWFGLVSPLALGFDLTWVLQEIDLNDYRTVLADNLLTGTINTANIADSIQRIIPDTDYELQQGKLYGIALGFNFNPAPNLFYVQLKSRPNPNFSHTFKVHTRNGKATTGLQWALDNFLTFLEVKTRAIEVPQASFTAETAAKYAPKNTGGMAGGQRIERAGSALYIWAKAHLLDHLPSVKAYSMSATGTDRLPKAGDTIYVNSKAFGNYVDPLSRRIVYTERDVIGDLRVDKTQVEINDEAVFVKYELLDGLGTPRTSLITDIYDRAKGQNPNPGDAAARGWQLLLDTLTTTIGPTNPNSVMSDGTAAYRISLSVYSGAYPTRPLNVENVYLAGLPFGEVTSGGELRVELVEFPSVSTGLVVFDIALKNRGWEYGDIAELQVKTVWR